MSTDALMMAITERHSANLGELATALSKAQAEIKTAAENATNPHFQSKYATLASVWEACREPLTRNGLSVVQQPIGDGDKVGVTTVLLHSSGQFMSSTISTTPDRKGPQAAGSALTYLRRYSLAAIASVCPDDGTEDDGEGATDRTPPQRAQASQSTAPRNDNAQNSARRGAPPQSRAVPPVASSPDAPTLKQQRHYRDLVAAIGLSGDEARARVSKLLGREIDGLHAMTPAEMDRVLAEMESQTNASA